MSDLDLDLGLAFASTGEADRLGPGSPSASTSSYLVSAQLPFLYTDIGSQIQDASRGTYHRFLDLLLDDLLPRFPI